VLIVDEVLAVGDIAFQLKCMDRMLEIQRSGATVVVVSHNLNAIRNMCQRTLVLHDGALRHDGDTNEAISLFHDLLGESREIEDSSASIHHGEGLEVRAVIERFELLDSEGRRTNHVRSDEDVVFEVDLRFTEPTQNPILGFFVFNAAGVQVYGESTAWRGGASYKSGDRVRTTINLRPSLVTGSYSCGVGLVSAGGVTLAREVRPLLIYVSGRNGVNGVADLAVRFDVQPLAMPGRRRRQATVRTVDSTPQADGDVLNPATSIPADPTVVTDDR
jgi:hypothetical protein